MISVAQPGFGGGGTGGLGNGSPPAESRGTARSRGRGYAPPPNHPPGAEPLVGGSGGHSLPKAHDIY